MANTGGDLVKARAHIQSCPKCQLILLKLSERRSVGMSLAELAASVGLTITPLRRHIRFLLCAGRLIGLHGQGGRLLPRSLRVADD